jgi:hypothetical protein
VKAARAPMKPAAKVVMTAVIAGGVWFACADPDAHVFIAGQYIAQLDCVTPGEAVDVLDGPPVDASCEATCVIPAQSDGAVYITGACAPFPPGDALDASPLCAKGLAAIRRSDLCLEAGPSNPLVDAGPPDAPAKAASSDAAREAGK